MKATKISAILLVFLTLFNSGCSKEKAKAKVQTLLGNLDSTNTIEGIDANKDGIRDDIEKIIEELPDLSRQAKNGLRYYQKSFEETLLKVTNRENALEYVNKEIKTYFCIDFTWFGKDETDNAIKKREVINLLLAATLNTEQRTLKYGQIDAWLDGQSINGNDGFCPEFSNKNKQNF
jgi:hypothetical protein